jgi:25S rRNA (adenine2142-N1)-methyltransferase
MSAVFAFSQAQANQKKLKQSMRNNDGKIIRNKKKKKRKRSRPPSLVEMTSLNSTKKHQKDQQKLTQTKKKRKVTLSGSVNGTFSSTAESLKIISDYHTLNKRIEQNNNNSNITEEEKKSQRIFLLNQQKAMGGIEVYQRASIFGAKTSKFVCAEWVTEFLQREDDSIGSRSLSTATSSSSRFRPRILDVGAINNQYLNYCWLDAVSIDLNAQHPSVKEIDFFDFSHEYIAASSTKATPPFDAIVMSLVLNFQGDPRKRGDMLALTSHKKMLKNNGLMFLALPSASLDNSRYCNEDVLVHLCETLGFSLIEKRRSAKLILFVFKLDTLKSDLASTYDVSSKKFKYRVEFPRKVVRDEKKGEKRNNFCCMLKNTV